MDISVQKDYKAAMKSHLDMGLLDGIFKSLSEETELDSKYKDHPLSGNCFPP